MTDSTNPVSRCPICRNDPEVSETGFVACRTVFEPSGKSCPMYGESVDIWEALRDAARPPLLARYQPCGCQVCVCENEDQCQGCGAKNCGSHPVGEIPNPVFEALAVLSARVPVAVKPLRWKNTDERKRLGCPDEATDCFGGKWSRWFIDGKQYFKSPGERSGKQGDADDCYTARIHSALSEIPTGLTKPQATPVPNTSTDEMAHDLEHTGDISMLYRCRIADRLRALTMQGDG